MAKAFLGDSMYLHGNSNRTYGISDYPFQYFINLKQLVDSDPANDYVIKRLDNEIVGASWKFSKLGGCSDGTFKINKKYENFDFVGADYAVDVWINERHQHEFRKIYEGMVIGQTESFKDSDILTIKTQGISTQMNRVMIGAYTPYINEQETVGRIVEDIIENYVMKHTYINECVISYEIYDYGLQNNAKLDYINFTQSAWDCIGYLGEIAGEYEWGVDKYRRFYFGPVNPVYYDASAVRHHFFYGKNISNYTSNKSWENLTNRLWIKDKYFSTTFENQNDLLVSEYQTTDNAFAETGVSTAVNYYSYQKLMQSFTTDKKSISKIEVKVNFAESDNFFSGRGFENYIDNGSFENSSIAPWLSKNIGIGVAEASTDAVTSGNRSLHVKTVVPGAGVFQDIPTPAQGNYTLRFMYLLLKGDMRVNVHTINALGEESVLPKWFSARYNDKTEGKSFVPENDFSFTIDEDYPAIRIYIQSSIKFLSEFYVDEVSLTYQGSALLFHLVDYDNPETILAEKLVNNPQGINGLPTIDTRSNNEDIFELDVHYNLCETDGVSTYGLMIERYGELQDDTAFQFRTNSAGGYGSGKLYGYNGTSWVDTSTDLWFKVYYNVSQEEYGVRESNSANPPTSDIHLLRKWCNGYLAGKDRPFEKVSFKVSGLREELEKETAPSIPLGRCSFRGPSGTPIPKSDSDNGWYKRQSSNRVIAQSIKHPYDLQLNGITLEQQKIGSPSGNIWVEIRSSKYGKYSSSPIDNGTSDTISAASVSTTKGSLYYTFATPPILKANRVYWIVPTSDILYASNYIRVFRYKGVDNYTGGSFIYYNGSELEREVATDLRFVLDAEESFNPLNIDTISYQIGENGLDATISSGEPLPDLAVMLKRLELKIKNFENSWS